MPMAPGVEVVHAALICRGLCAPRSPPRLALGQAWVRSLTVVCWPMPWLRANRDHACSAPLLGEASRLRPKGLAATRVYRGVCHRRVPFFPGARKGEMLPVLQIQRNSAVGETVPSAAPGTRLRLRARCSGYSVGRRSPLEPATRKGSPGVEFSTAQLSIVMGTKYEFRQASEGGNAARFANTAKTCLLYTSPSPRD